MKARIDKKDFQQMLEQANMFINRHASLPVLLHVVVKATRGKMPRLLVAATDLEQSIAAWLMTDVEEEGEVLIEARPLLAFVKSLPKDAEVLLETHTKTAKNEYGEYEETFLTVSAGGASMTFRSLPDELPLPKPIRAPHIRVDALQFQLALQRVVFAASKDPSRPTLQGVLFEVDGDTLHLVATDGYRLAHAVLNAHIPEGLEIPKYRWIVPAHTLANVEKMLRKQKYNGMVVIQPDFPEEGTPRTAFRWAGVSVATYVIDSQYPKWEAIIEQARKNTNLYVITHEPDLTRAVKALKPAAKAGSNMIRFNVNGVVQMSARAVDVGETVLTVPADIQGHEGEEEEYIIVLNYKYLEDVLKALKKRQVVLGFQPDNTRPVLITPKGDPHYEYMQMPMRIEA